MKIIALSLLTFYAFQNMWHPHEKEMIALMWKAEHSPEKVLAKRNSKIEQMDYEKFSNEEEENLIRGISKFTMRSFK